jgi:hypothetical protein
MDQLILDTLSTKWEVATGWQIWTHVAERLRLPAEHETPEYRSFKAALTRLEVAKLVESVSGPERRLAKAAWQLTDLGWERAVEEEAPQVSDEWVKRRITATEPAPRVVWKELLRRQKAGELDIVFVKSKGEDA